MLKRFFVLSCLLCSFLFVAKSGYAQVSFSSNRSRFGYQEGRLSNFSRRDNTQSWKRGADEKKKLYPTADIVDRINGDAIDLMLNPSEVLCYNITTKAPSDDGFVIQGYKALGKCGKLEGDALYSFQEKFLATVESIDKKNQKGCSVRPDVLLRFKKGLDSADVLVSSIPSCHFISVKYAGETDVFNVMPISSWVKKFISVANSNKSEIKIEKPKKVDYTGKDNQNVKEEKTGLEDWKKEKEKSTGGWIKKNYGFSSGAKNGEKAKEKSDGKAKSGGASSSTKGKVKRNW
jgi:hypothetical protein